jgi:hypothetical protein
MAIMKIHRTQQPEYPTMTVTKEEYTKLHFTEFLSPIQFILTRSNLDISFRTFIFYVIYLKATRVERNSRRKTYNWRWLYTVKKKKR